MDVSITSKCSRIVYEEYIISPPGNMSPTPQTVSSGKTQVSVQELSMRIEEYTKTSPPVNMSPTPQTVSPGKTSPPQSPSHLERHNFE